MRSEAEIRQAIADLEISVLEMPRGSDGSKLATFTVDALKWVLQEPCIMDSQVKNLRAIRHGRAGEFN